MVDAPLIQPHYLIKTGINEVIRSLSRCIAFSTVVVLSKKLGINEVSTVPTVPIVPKKIKN